MASSSKSARLADDLREAGHTVHTPDVFEGRTFATLAEGMAFARESGFDTLTERAVAALATSTGRPVAACAAMRAE